MTPGSGRDSLPEEIAKEEALLAELEKAREQARARLQALKEKLALAGRPPVTEPTSTMTPQEKITLFRSLFRGREDVFPRLWINSRTGKKGYAPTCLNEWVRGVCEKPRTKCGDCPNRAFTPVTDQAIQDHLQGRHVMGVYPLLKDETCWFLAADFDKSSWADDVGAFAETCRAAGIPAAIERSRSGNGAHAWFFFSDPMAASVARRMGCHLITETMARRHQLSMESYDRLFPNQDTMPRGGFGNLIALPLQREPRNQGNTVFIDEKLKPYDDQWAYLASLERIAPSAVEAIAKDAVRQGKVIGVKACELTDDADAAAPWEQSPSAKRRKARIDEPLPSEVNAVFAQRVFVEKSGLPSALLDQIKRLAAFQNPEFYKKQSMRLSTAMTPRVITCAEEMAQHIALPRGCLADLEGLLAEYEVRLAVDDKRHTGESLELRFQGQLTPVQHEAANAILKHDMGIIVAPPGAGKTVIGAYLVAARARNTLVLVHRKPLLDQWVAQLSTFLGVDAKDIGRIGGGKRDSNGWLDVAMLQSLGRKGSIDDQVATYGHVIVDECHHLPAVSFERALAAVKARFVTGLTATPYRRDGHQPIIHMQCGPVRFSVDSKSQAAKRPFDHRLIVRETAFHAKEPDGKAPIQEIYAALAADEARNGLIIDDVISALAEGRSPILLTERRDHLEYLAGKLRSFARHLVVLRGGMKTSELRKAAAQLASIPEGEERLVLATGRYVGEGFDDARLDTLFLALPVSWKGTLVQYAGRLHRLHPGKREVRIYDYVDRDVPALGRMFAKRLKGYRAIGYAPVETSTSSGQPKREIRVEWEQEAFRSPDKLI